jgi:methylglyoxal reductase
MEKRKLGNSDLEISPLVYGAWAIGGFMWGGADDNDAISAIHAAIDGGINIIDTAPIYGLGRSEELVGKALKSKKGKALVATKCILHWDSNEGTLFAERVGVKGEKVNIYRDGRPKQLMLECEQSLRRLQVEVIDLYQLHWPDPVIPIEDSIGALVRLKEQGKIRAIGVSNYDISQLKTAVGITQIDTLQPPYSILRRGIEAELLPYCIEKNISAICYSPMERGLLTGAVSPSRNFEPSDHRSEHPYFTVENRTKILTALERIKPICDNHGVTFSQVVLNWTVQQKGITGAIVGGRNAKQMEENVGAMRFRLTPAECKQMEEVFKEECGSFAS